MVFEEILAMSHHKDWLWIFSRVMEHQLKFSLSSKERERKWEILIIEIEIHEEKIENQFSVSIRSTIKKTFHHKVYAISYKLIHNLQRWRHHPWRVV